MKTYFFQNLTQDELQTLTERPAIDYENILKITKSIVNDVKIGGDKTLRILTERFDKAKITNFKVSQSEINKAEEKLPEETKLAIRTAQKNIETFHKSQIVKENPIETMPGVTCFRELRGIEKVGLYIPGGTAVLFSTLLMLATPAKVAGCKEIILCTPPRPDGSITAELLYAAKICGVSQIFKVGGGQAIAAMAYGTKSIPKVYKIFGPGNQYVTAAKMIVSTSDANVSIDMPAGPSEVFVIADENANPSFVAADLLSQAEHGDDSQVVLATPSEALAKKVQKEVEKQLALLPRAEMTKGALKESLIMIAENLKQCFEFANLFAPEHLIINTENPRNYISLVQNAGSVFLGQYTPESAGDYASGTNHVLPTYGYARMYSGVSTDYFLKKITFQEITKEGLENIGDTIVQLAIAEELDAHANAVKIRRKS